METLVLAPATTATGTVHLPGSKSLSNRALLLAALADGETRLSNVLESADTRVMRTALHKLGVNLTTEAPYQDYCIQGCRGQFPVKQAELHLGNAGTAMRPLVAALTASEGEFTLSGDPRMHERPIRDLVDALRQMGAQVEYLNSEGYPPLRITGKGLPGGHASVRGDVSSQFLTGLLMAAPLCQKPLEILVEGELVSKPYIAITLALMEQFGVHVTAAPDYSRFLTPTATYQSPGTFLVEGDASSATYFLAAAAIAGGPVRVVGMGHTSVQGDKAFVDVLQSMGAQVEWGDHWVEVRKGHLCGLNLDLNHIPDAAMTVAALGLFAEGSTTIRGIGNWRVKETDRIHAMATELAKTGAAVESGEDWIRVSPPQIFRPAVIDTYDDHRMAMCLSLACFGGVPITIRDPGCVSKTFPEYFREFARIVH